MLSSMFFLSTGNKQSLKSKQPSSAKAVDSNSVAKALGDPCQGPAPHHGSGGAQDGQGWRTEDCRVPGTQWTTRRLEGCQCKVWARCYVQVLHGFFWVQKVWETRNEVGEVRGSIHRAQEGHNADI